VVRPSTSISAGEGQLFTGRGGREGLCAPTQGAHQFIDCDGFGQNIIHAQAHGVDRRPHVDEGADDDDGVAVQGAKGGHEIQPLDARHLQISDEAGRIRV